MIFFDGLYSFVSLLLSFASIKVLQFIDKTDFKRYPFGKAAIEPFLVIIKSSVLLTMCSTTLLNSIKDIFNGGVSVNTTSAINYAIISSVGCLVIFIFIRLQFNSSKSNIIKTESNQWLMDFVLSLCVLIGFIMTTFLDDLNLNAYVPLIDPLMTALSSGLFLLLPLKTIKTSFRELIHAESDENIKSTLSSTLREIMEMNSIPDLVFRHSKVGRELRIEIDFILDETSSVHSIDDMDNIREEVFTKLSCLESELWLNISFTKNKKWAI